VIQKRRGGKVEKKGHFKHRCGANVLYLEDHFFVLELLRQQLRFAGAGQTQDIAHILVFFVHVRTHGVTAVDKGLYRIGVCDHTEVFAAVGLHNYKIACLQRCGVSGTQREVANGLLELDLQMSNAKKGK